MSARPAASGVQSIPPGKALTLPNSTAPRRKITRVGGGFKSSIATVSLAGTPARTEPGTIAQWIGTKENSTDNSGVSPTKATE